jgi:hypothetical protein
MTPAEMTPADAMMAVHLSTVSLNVTTVALLIIRLLIALSFAAIPASEHGTARMTLVVIPATTVLIVMSVDVLGLVIVTQETARETDLLATIRSTIVAAPTLLDKAPTPLVALSVLVLLGLITTIIDSFSHQG